MKNRILLVAFSILTSCAHSESIQQRQKSESCSNVKIYQSYAYATCEEKIVIHNLNDQLEIATNIKADDLAIADDYLFTIEMNDRLSIYSLKQANNPILIQSIQDVPAKFFTGIDANNGYLVVSGGLKNPSFFRYDSSGLKRISIDTKTNEYFGRPDVSLFPSLDKNGNTEPNQIQAVFSLDVSLTYKWGAQVVSVANDQLVQERFVKLESGLSPFQLLGYAPTNFPISSAVIRNQIYLTHWKTHEILNITQKTGAPEVILKTDFTVSHMTSDSEYLYFVSRQKPGEFYQLNPKTKTLKVIKDDRLVKPTNIAVLGSNWIIADLKAGLVKGILD